MSGVPAGTPKAVVVTTLDPGLSPSYKDAIIANRRHYAQKHGKRHAQFIFWPSFPIHLRPSFPKYLQPPLPIHVLSFPFHLYTSPLTLNPFLAPVHFSAISHHPLCLSKYPSRLYHFFSTPPTTSQNNVQANPHPPSGYVAFFPNTTDYPLNNAPTSWSTIPALRHAMTLYPHTPLLFYLTSTALIMNPSLNLESHIMNPQRLESLMIVDKPVVPPDSVIRTFSHLKGDRVDFVLTQDHEGLAGGSMIIRAGDWAKFFLDTWFDPLYRSYNFQKAEAHALEHIVQ